MFPTIPLALSLAGLSTDEAAPWAGGLRRTGAWLAAAGYRAVQLDGAAAGLRARDLDRSARRDLAGFLKRSGIGLSGIDLWIPQSHFSAPERTERAVEAAVAAIELAAGLSRLLAEPGAAVLAMTLPASGEGPAQVAANAERHGVRIANHRLPERGQGNPNTPAVGIGIDPAALLLRGIDPGTEAARAGAGLVQARLSDADEAGRVTLGKGSLDLAAYLAGVVAAGYNTPLPPSGKSPMASYMVVDVRGLADQAAGARAALALWSPS